MIARTAGTVIFSLIVFILVSLLVFLGVLWLTGGTVRAATIGAVCGLAAAFVVGAASTATRRTGGPPRQDGADGNDGSDDDADRRAQ
jgi:drug/metabolite transporter (DMT)-like permease